MAPQRCQVNFKSSFNASIPRGNQGITLGPSKVLQFEVYRMKSIFREALGHISSKKLGIGESSHLAQQ